MGSVNARDPLSVLEGALRGGITCFQFREKGPHALQGDEKLAFAKSCQQLCHTFNVPFIVNDDVALAKRIDADGVHVGQDDLSAISVREQIGADKIIGVSVHSIEEATQAMADRADYVGMGPIYETHSKDDAQPVSGTVQLEKVRKLFPNLPIVGIGGITSENLKDVFAHGADGISLISAIASADDSESATRSIRQAVDLVRVSVT